MDDFRSIKRFLRTPGNESRGADIRRMQQNKVPDSALVPTESLSSKYPPFEVAATCY
jgi:hypothetical protein